MPKDLYQGAYLKDIAQKLINKYQNALLEREELDSLKIVKEFSISEILTEIKQDLKALDVEHDFFL